MTDSKPQVLVGTHYHPGGADALLRQEIARESLLKLKNVRLVNLQFPDAPIEIASFESYPTLHNDSVKASGQKGVRKPIGSEAFYRLACKAKEYNIPYFSWVNSDITVKQEAIDYVIHAKLDGYVFSRMDYSPETGKDSEMFVGGQDCFVFNTDWWLKNQERFRPYVNSEAYWDNIYTTVTLCHGRSILLNRTGLIRHREHPRVWSKSPFGEYNRHFASLDNLYLFIWQGYIKRLREMRARNASEQEEMELQKSCFVWNPSLSAKIKQSVRSFKAHLRRHGWLSYRPIQNEEAAAAIK